MERLVELEKVMPRMNESTGLMAKANYHLINSDKIMDQRISTWIVGKTLRAVPSQFNNTRKNK